MQEFSTILRTKLQIPFKIHLDNRIKSVNDHNDIKNDAIYKNAFINYLSTLHTLMRSSVPLMEAAYHQSQKINESVSIPLSAYYEKHIKEELYHDEWLLEDLKSIGISKSEILAKRPSMEVAELAGSQYYWIYHWHPISLLGYIAVMEGYPSSEKDIKQIQLKTGFPTQAFRTLAKHSYLDPDHRADLDKVLDRLPLSNYHKEWITLNALYTFKKLKDILYF